MLEFVPVCLFVFAEETHHEVPAGHQWAGDWFLHIKTHSEIRRCSAMGNSRDPVYLTVSTLYLTLFIYSSSKFQISYFSTLDKNNWKRTVRFLLDIRIATTKGKSVKHINILFTSILPPLNKSLTKHLESIKNNKIIIIFKLILYPK